MTPGHGCLTQNSRLRLTDTTSKIISSQPAHLIITHPFIPSREGKQHTINHSLPTRTQHLKSPRPRKGSGVCDARAWLLNSKQSLEADRYLFSSNLDKCSSSLSSSNMLLKTVSRILQPNPCFSPSHTPLSPL